MQEAKILSKGCLVLVLLADEQYLRVADDFNPQLNCVWILFIATEDGRRVNAAFVCCLLSQIDGFQGNCSVWLCLFWWDGTGGYEHHFGKNDFMLKSVVIKGLEYIQKQH